MSRIRSAGFASSAVNLCACRQEGNGRTQGLICFEGRIEAIRFNGEKRGLSSSIRTIGENFAEFAARRAARFYTDSL